MLASWQCPDIGLSSSSFHRAVSSGQFEPVAQSVVRMAGAPDSWLQRVMASVLTGGPHALASHRSAAALRSLDGFDRVPMEIVVPRWMRRPRFERPRPRIHEATDLEAADTSLVHGIPTTTVVRTLIDLGAVAHVHRVEQALDDACRRQLCTLDQVRKRYVEVSRRGRRGCGTIRRLLEQRLGDEMPPGSTFEARTLRLVRSHPLIPGPILQHPVHDGDFVAYLDLSWPRGLVGVECQSVAYHLSAQRMRADMRRLRILNRLGWWVIQVTWEDLEARPDEVLHEIVVALTERGVI